MKVRAVEFVSYGVSNMDKALAFYADPDGSRLWLHQRKDGTCG